MSRADELTTTSYALLGLLTLRAWSTYELAQQMQRSMHLWWPRAASRVYDEPKRLVRLGLASARDERAGRRPRTVYTITGEGRAAFERWLAAPAGIFKLEFEAVLKVLFADQGDTATLLANLAAIRAAVDERRALGRQFYTQYLGDGGPFPERLHLIALVGDLYDRFLDACASWADDAEAQVAAWSSTRHAPDPRPVFERLLSGAQPRSR